jgi:hypothetical protein
VVVDVRVVVDAGRVATVVVVWIHSVRFRNLEPRMSLV